jgi:hypothetical protein
MERLTERRIGRSKKQLHVKWFCGSFGTHAVLCFDIRISETVKLVEIQ